MQRPGAEGVQKKQGRDFLGGPVAKTLCFQCWGPKVQSLVKELDPTS